MASNKPTIIFVANDKKEITNINRGTKCHVHELFVYRNQIKKIQYDSLTNLTNTGNIEIHIEKDNGDINILNLPENLQKRVGEFIAIQNDPSVAIDYTQKTNNQNLFDCCSFVHYVHNVKETDDLSDSWNVCKFDSKNLEVGDVVLTGHQEGNVIIGVKSHYSIYIGDGKYIGKFGPYSKGITITNLDEIGKFYPYNKVFLLKPKK